MHRLVDRRYGGQICLAEESVNLDETPPEDRPPVRGGQCPLVAAEPGRHRQRQAGSVGLENWSG